MSVAVITFSTSHGGRLVAGWLLKNWSQLAWHTKLSVDQFVLSLAGRATHTHLCNEEVCVNAAIGDKALVDASAAAKWVESHEVK